MSKLQSIKNSVIKTLIRVVLYLRLSDEDRDKLTSDQISKSIKNQELMLRKYAENEGFKIVGVYDDDRIRKNDTHTGIIDKQVWYTVQERLKEKSRSQ